MLWNPFRGADGEQSSNVSESMSTRFAKSPPRLALRIAEFRAHGHEVLEACLEPGGARMVSVGGDRCAFLWDVTRGSVVRKLFGHEQSLTSCALLPGTSNSDGSAAVLATGSVDKCVRLWDVRAAARGGAVQVLSDATDNITRVILGAGDIVTASMDGHLRRYDLRAARILDDNVGASVAALARSGDGRCFVAATMRAGGRLVLIDAVAGRRLQAYAGHANALYRCSPAFSADDAHVLSGGEAGEVIAWDIVTAEKVLELRNAHRRVVSWVEPHPDASSPAAMLTASYDGDAKLWVHRGH